MSAVGLLSGGKTRSTVINVTQETATMPMGMYHLPSENGPGWRRFRPEVMRRKIGVTYDV